MKRIGVLILVGILLFGLSAVAVASKKELTVGREAYTEQYVMGQLMKRILEEHGFQVKLRTEITSTALRTGLKKGNIDVYAEYTGTGWVNHLGHTYKSSLGHESLYDKVKAADRAKNNLVWLNPIWNHNSYAFAVWPEFAKDHGLDTLSDLAGLYRKRDGKIDTFIGLDFSQRPDGLPALEDHYDFQIAESALHTGLPGASVAALANRNTTVALVFTTDSEISQYDWTVLRDDKRFWPPYDLVPVVREKILEKYPEVEQVLNELVASFPGGGEPWSPEYMRETQRVWSSLNGQVDIERMSIDEVAHRYLVNHGLVEGSAG